MAKTSLANLEPELESAPMDHHSSLSKSHTWTLVADAYAVDVVPVFESAAHAALAMVDISPGDAVLDVAAGPGTLSLPAARHGAEVTAVDYSFSMLENLRRRAAEAGLEIEVMDGDGQNLELPDASFDAAFSMFGLMFFPRRDLGFSELHRVLRPGRPALVASWADLTSDSRLAAAIGVLIDLLGTPSSPEPWPLSNPADCLAEMQAAGFADVTVHEHTVHFHYADPQAMIQRMEGSSAPVALLRQNLGTAWPGFREEWLRRLVELLGDGPQEVSMNALLTLGRAADLNEGQSP